MTNSITQDSGVVNKVIWLSFYLAIFGGALSISNILPVTIFLYYFLFIFLIPFFFIKYRSINLNLLIFTILFLVIGSIQIQNGNNYSSNLFKIVIATFVHYLFYFYFFKYSNYNVKFLIKKYLKGAYFISVFPFIQLFFYLIDLPFGYDYSWFLPSINNPLNSNVSFRAYSLLPEPSHFAYVMLPAAFISLNKIIDPTNNTFVTYKRAIILLGSFLLSFSSSGFFGLAVGLGLIAISKFQLKKLLLVLVILFGGLQLLYSHSDAFKVRVDNFALTIYEPNTVDLATIDVSSFTLFNNAYVAISNFRDHLLMGTGLGSHPIAYKKYSLTNAMFLQGTYQATKTFNTEDANSLILRIVSETGLIGVALLGYFLINFSVIRITKSNYELWLISNAVLVAIATACLRMGNYSTNGTPFFILIFYYTGIYNKLKS